MGRRGAPRLPVRGNRSLRLAFFLLAAPIALLSAASPVEGQVLSRMGVIVGTVSTQQGDVRLPGALIIVTSPAGAPVDQEVSDGEGLSLAKT